ncbi:hypothetical protein B566_EDAN004478 [Ephemera danica]|nr:hypothetical protein B566_EDAN004478 [Ephemera danica]
MYTYRVCAETVESLSESIQVLLQTFRYPMESFTMVYLVLKECRFDVQEAYKRILEAQDELHKMTLRQSARILYHQPYYHPYYAAAVTAAASSAPTYIPSSGLPLGSAAYPPVPAPNLYQNLNLTNGGTDLSRSSSHTPNNGGSAS